MAGNGISRINENIHPLRNATIVPENMIPNDTKIVPIFSPKALLIDEHSLERFAESDEISFVSNQDMSYCSMDLRYASLVFLVILSAKLIKKAKYK